MTKDKTLRCNQRLPLRCNNTNKIFLAVLSHGSSIFQMYLTRWNLEFGIFCLIETLITSWIEEVTRVTFSTITQLQQNPVFSNHLGKSKFEQSIVKLQGLSSEGKLGFGSNYRNFRKRESSRNRNSTVHFISQLTGFGMLY